MRADIHDGPEHKVQSEAGYIDARPHRQDRGNLLHRTAGPYNRVTVRISFAVRPLPSAPRVWVSNSCIFPRAAIIPRLRIERSRGVSVLSPQVSPQPYWVTRRWKSRLKSSTFSRARST